MDPLSVTASAIAIAQALFAIGQGIRAFRSLSNGPAELSDLERDLITLQTVLHLTQIHIHQSPNSQLPVDYPPAIKSLRQDLSETAAKLDTLARGLVAESKGVDQHGLHRISRRSWYKEKDNINKLRDRAQTLYINLSTCLAAFNAVHANHQTKLLLDLKRTVETQDADFVESTFDLYQRVEAAQCLIEPQLGHVIEVSHKTVDYLQQNLAKLDTLQLSITQAARYESHEEYHMLLSLKVQRDLKSIEQTSKPMPSHLQLQNASTPASQPINARREPISTHNASPHCQKCKLSCKCRCHKISRRATPQYLQLSMGALRLEYNCPLWPFGTTCDSRSCHSNPDRFIRVAYSFPRWWASRALIASMSWNSLTCLSATMWFRIPRIIDIQSLIWFSDLEQLSQALSRNEVLPTDIEQAYGVNLLTWALGNGLWSHIPVLLQCGADARVLDLTGRSAIHWAREFLQVGPYYSFSEQACQIWSQIVSLDDNDDVKPGSIIHDAILKRNSVPLEDCIALQPSCIDNLDDLGYSPLHWAVKIHDLDAVNTLVELGADLNCRTRHNGKTPLHLASLAGSRDLVTILIAAGALVDIQDDWGGSALNINSYGDADLVEQLLNQGANPNLKTKLGNTPLHHLVMYSRGNIFAAGEDIRVIRALAEAGADLDLEGGRGWRPLFGAACLTPWLVPPLLEFGAQRDCLGSHGQCILHELARTRKVLEGDFRASLFIGLNPDLPSKTGMTPLDWMASRITGRSEEEPSIKEVVSFTDLICEIRQLNWDKGLFLDLKEHLERNGEHLLMTKWLLKQKERQAQDNEAGDIICSSLDMWWYGENGRSRDTDWEYGSEYSVPDDGREEESEDEALESEIEEEEEVEEQFFDAISG